MVKGEEMMQTKEVPAEIRVIVQMGETGVYGVQSNYPVEVLVLDMDGMDGMGQTHELERVLKVDGEYVEYVHIAAEVMPTFITECFAQIEPTKVNPAPVTPPTAEVVELWSVRTEKDQQWLVCRGEVLNSSQPSDHPQLNLVQSWISTSKPLLRLLNYTVKVRHARLDIELDPDDDADEVLQELLATHGATWLEQFEFQPRGQEVYGIFD
jgi:hypothetical protein